MKTATNAFEKAGLERKARPTFDLTWPVFSEYAATETEDDIILDAVLQPIRMSRMPSGGLHFTLWHLEDQENRSVERRIVPPPDLFLTFARSMPQKRLTTEEALEFVGSWVKEYGVLGTAGVSDGQDRRMRESLSNFFKELRRASRVLDLYEASRPEPDPRALKKILGIPEDSKLATRDLEAYALREVADRVGQVVRDECYPLLARQVNKAGRTKGFDYDLGFRSLLGAMYLQMMLWLTDESNVRRCARPNCRGIIPSHARTDKKTCSDACRKWLSDYGR